MCWSIGAAAVPLAAAVVLCAVGLSAPYDGMVSWLNPLTAGACCGSVLFVLIAALTWSLLAAKPPERPR